MEQHRIEDKSNDRKYYVTLPRLVFYKSASVYDLALYFAIKDIAGEDGECTISTPDLAGLAMMSVGQVSKSRKFLIETGLLEGEVRRDPGYQQPVWHLRIPDIWQENITWCKEHPKIKDRLEYRAGQLSQGESGGEPSPGETLTNELSPGEKGTTPGEKGTTPGEKGTTPGETKNILKEDPKEESKEVQGANAPAPLVRNPGAFAALQSFEKNKGQVDYSTFPEDVREIIREFCRLWRLHPPAPGRKGGEFACWLTEARELADACGEFGLKALEKAASDYFELDLDKRFTVARPGSVVRWVRATAGKLRAKPKKKVYTWEEYDAYLTPLYPNNPPTQAEYQAYLRREGVSA